MSPVAHEYRPTRVVAGVLFFCIGLAFLLDSLHVWTVQIVDVWPLLVVAFGTAVLMGRAKRARVEEDRSGQLAVAEERVRIARELHDIVAHGVSLMTIQIAAARRAQKTQPEAAEESLQAAEETGRQSLAELQGMLSMLRGADASIGAAGRPQGDATVGVGDPRGRWQGPWQPPGHLSRADQAAAIAEKAVTWANWATDWAANWRRQSGWGHGHWHPPPPRPTPPPGPGAGGPAAARPAGDPGGPSAAARSPLPRLADVDHLVTSLRSAGLDIKTTVVGVPPQLSPGAELAIYRVVQEALTNTMRYAPKSHVQLEITYAPDHVLIYVDDDGPGPPAGKTASSGHGLVGMQERVAAVGGTLTVGPRQPGPGWRVHAWIPVIGVMR